MNTLSTSEINAISTCLPAFACNSPAAPGKEALTNNTTATIFIGSAQTRFDRQQKQYYLHTQDTVVPPHNTLKDAFIFNIEVLKNYRCLLKSSQTILLVLGQENDNTRAIACKLFSMAAEHGKKAILIRQQA